MLKHDDLFDEYGHNSITRLPMHKNPGLEIVYILTGHLMWQCEGQQEVIPPRSVYFTLPWQEHGSATEFESGHELYYIVLKMPPNDNPQNHNLSLPPALGLTAPSSKILLQTFTDAPHHAWPASDLIATLMPALIQELTTPGPFHDQRLITLTTQTLLELARIITINPQKAATQNTSTRRINDLLKELAQRFDHPWTLAEMAHAAGLKRTQFTTLFHQATGDTPITYLNRLRIAKARNLLKNSTDSITTIAFNCGYSSSQHFAHIFKKMTGINARTFRQKGLPQLHPRHVPKKHIT